MKLEHRLSALLHQYLILDLTTGFIELDQDNCKTGRGTLKFADLVRLRLEILR